MIVACPQRRSTAGQPGAELQQAFPGSALNRATWHPDNHRAPLVWVYTCPLYSPLRATLRRIWAHHVRFFQFGRVTGW